ncbi:ROK family transcriptional regulator [Kineosporia sp. A_224]|uniref:ROK family transcriptional regulator n=1 Tax=Kineosporia sp. A_224 TaxID=1962180 RepID=UPI000B4A95CF|nr:ROK family transcriptional regulator [Kineosporia sp. A_224]
MPPKSRTSAAAKGGTQEDVRRHNLGTVLQHLHLAGPLTRAELTARMGLNRSTIAALVSELVVLGAVREERPAGSQTGAGRPSLVVRPADDHLQVLAADVGVDRVVVALVGLGGRVVARRRRRLTSGSPASVASLIRRLVDAVLTDPAAGEHILGLGVSVPGVIRHSDGCVRFAPNLGWVDAPFGDLLAQQLGGMPVSVGNDADLGILAEHRRGAARGYDDVVFIAGEVGVGGGLIVGGAPLVGAGGYAGELGHVLVHPQGRPCRCGARGCWETEIGGPAIARALGLGSVTTEDLVEAMRRAAAEGSTALDGVAHHVGLGLATIVNIINPRLVIIGGLLRELFPSNAAAVRASLDAAALTATAEQVSLVTPELGGDAVLVGASELAWQDVLDDPAGTLRRNRRLAPTRTMSATMSATVTAS